MMDNRRGILEFTCDAKRLPNGNTIIVDAGDETCIGSEVFEVDYKGSIVWYCECDFKFAHSAHRLENGNTLITDTTNDRIIEVDRDSNIVFTSDDWGNKTGTLSDGSHLWYPNDAHELADKTIIITDRNNNRFLIVDRQGNVIWEFSENVNHPHNADMLDNGNIIFADSDNNMIYEVTRDKKIVWSYGDKPGQKLQFPRDADRLENGNTLITDSRHHRVIEVTPEGDIVWEYKVDYFAGFYQADRLENGNTLISDQNHHQVIEVDQYGNIVWLFRNRRQFKEIMPKLTNGFFTKRDENDFPLHWSINNRFAEGGGKYIFEEGCPGIEYDQNGAFCLVQHIAAKPGEVFTFSGSIKTVDIEEGSFACFQAFFLDSYGGPICFVAHAQKSEMLSGSHDWHEQNMQIEVPPRATTLEFRLFINGKGKVLMKDLMMFK